MNIAQKISKLFLYQDMHQEQQNKAIKKIKKKNFFFQFSYPLKIFKKKEEELTIK